MSSSTEENNNNKNKEEVRWKKLEPPKGAHALGNPDITPETYKASQQQQQQQQQTETPYTKLGDNNKDKKEEDEDDGGLATAIRQSLDTTLDPYLQEIQRANREKMRRLAQHEVIKVPYQKKIETGRTWVNPLTGEEEPVYKKGEDTWQIKEFPRYKITKKDWDDAERVRLESVKYTTKDPAKAKDLEDRYNAFLAHKFFDMMPEDLVDCDYAVIKDYIASAIWRTVVGLPYSQEQSRSSLTPNTPVR